MTKSITRLIKRHKASIGYLILTIGTTVALFFSAQAVNTVNERAEVQAGIICENVTRVDKQTLANLHTRVDRELVKSLHISDTELKVLIHQQFQVSANERKSLRPSIPADACSSKITTLLTKTK